MPRKNRYLHSPLIPDGTADAILSMEPVEALRHLPKIKKDGILITDINPVVPPIVSVGVEKYPKLEEIYMEIEARCRLIKIDALKIARESGAIIAKNMVILGALAGVKILPFESKLLLESISENIPAKYVKTNKKAFIEGYKVAAESI